MFRPTQLGAEFLEQSGAHLSTLFNMEEVGPGRRSPRSQHVNSLENRALTILPPSGLPGSIQPHFSLASVRKRGEDGGKNSELDSDLQEDPRREEDLSRSSLAEAGGWLRKPLKGV